MSKERVIISDISTKYKERIEYLENKMIFHGDLYSNLLIDSEEEKNRNHRAFKLIEKELRLIHAALIASLVITASSLGCIIYILGS